MSKGNVVDHGHIFVATNSVHSKLVGTDSAGRVTEKSWGTVGPSTSFVELFGNTDASSTLSRNTLLVHGTRVSRNSLSVTSAPNTEGVESTTLGISRAGFSQVDELTGSGNATKIQSTLVSGNTRGSRSATVQQTLVVAIIRKGRGSNEKYQEERNLH